MNRLSLKRFLAASCAAIPLAAAAQTMGPPLTGTYSAVNVGPGDQSDPHVSSDLVAYTSDDGANINIRVYDFANSTDFAIPNNGEFDHLSDIDGQRVVFSREGAQSDIYLYDLTEGSALAVDWRRDSDRRGAAIGGNTVAWQERSIGQAFNLTEVAVHDLATSITTVLTADSVFDGFPSVAPDGSALVWNKCRGDFSAYDVFSATRNGSGWTVNQLTTAATPEGGCNINGSGDTNGTIAAYSSTRGGETDIYWQAVGGGAETQLSLPGFQRNPNISNNLIAFEHSDTGGTAYEVMLLDLDTNTLYQLTQTPESEFLSDISQSADGLVRVVWTVSVNDFDVRAFSFRLPDECQPPAPTSCANPGERPLHATLAVKKTLLGLSLSAQVSPPALEANLSILNGSAALSFPAEEGDGLLCIANGEGGSRRASSGRVVLNGVQEAGPADIHSDAASVETQVPLQTDNELTATVSGLPGAAYTVRVYGAAPECASGGE